MDLAPDPVAAGFAPDRLARIDEHLCRHYVEPGRIAGYQVLVGRGGHVAHRSSNGAMDVESGEALHDQAIWRWYSMTKPVTGVALLTLLEQARCKLDDPVHRFLPEWREATVSVPRGDGTYEVVAPDRPVTVKHALMHMTGIGRGPEGARLDFQAMATGGSPRAVDRTMTLTGLSEALAREPLRHQPGERWVYTWSSDLCARLVEAIAGETFGAYLQRTIFDPLGMASTGFAVPEAEAGRVTSLYARTPAARLQLLDDRARQRLCRVPALESGGGGLVGTLDDYARFCEMLRAGGTLDGVRVLGRPTIELMRTNHLPGGGELREFATPGGYGEVGFEGRGFGLQVAVGLGPAATAGVGPAGDYMWGGAASTAFWIDPVEDLYVVFMTQLLPSGTYDFRGQLRSIVYGAVDD